MVGRPHNFEEMTRCKVVQNHVFYSAQGHRPVFLSFGSHENQNGEHVFNETIDWTHVNNLCIAYMTVPAFFPDGWRVWFGTAIFWCGDAGDHCVSYMKEAMNLTDILVN